MDVGAALSIVIALAVFAAVVGMIMFLKRRPAATSRVSDMRIDVNSLGATQPPSSGPQLEIRHVPVRLALLVFAPVGRGKELPGDDTIELAEAIVPGLASCLRAHGTRVVTWPAQLSSQGFVQSFFANAPLPGNRGQGTPWCGAAGKGESDQGAFLAGMLVVAERPNNLGQFVVNGSHEWLDLLRVKGHA